MTEDEIIQDLVQQGLEMSRNEIGHDTQLECVVCHQPFTFYGNRRIEYFENGLAIPRRCGRCNRKCNTKRRIARCERTY